MKAKCPHCDGTSICLTCNNTGQIEVGFAEGNLWTRFCAVCDFENGGRIEKGDKEPKESSGKCVMCNNPTKWLLLGAMDEVLGDETEISS